jgi:glycosyltransferase involved in cell wall biosynthesis
MNHQPDYREISDPAVMAVQPLVSVQMLAYRHERFLAKAIEGVIAQICDFPIELVIAEDCSPDGTLAIAVDYQRRYPHLIRVITGDKNVGMHRNAARFEKVSRGKYIAICEGDDYWHHPQKLQMQVALMTSNPAMTFCHTDFDRKTRFRTWHSKHRNHPTPWLAQGDAYLALLYEWSVMTATTIFRRDVMVAFKNSEFDNSDWPFGDYNLLIFASLIGTIGYIEASTTTYRKVRGSAGNQSNNAHLRVTMANEECVEAFLRKRPVNAADECQIKARLKRKIYQAAFYAERIDLMQSTYEWLRMNGFEQPHLQHRARIAAVKFKFPVRALRAVKNFIDLRLSSIPA